MVVSAAERSLASKVAAQKSWAATTDRTARTANGNAAHIAKAKLRTTRTAAEKRRDAAHAAAMLQLQLRSVKGRRLAAENIADAEAAEAEIAALSPEDRAIALGLAT